MPAIGKNFGSDAWRGWSFSTHLRVPRCAPCVPVRLESDIKDPLSESRRKTVYLALKLCKEQIGLLELDSRTRNPAFEGFSLPPHGVRRPVNIRTSIHQTKLCLRGEVLDALQVLIEALKNEPPQGNCSQQGKEGTAAQ